MCIRIQFDIMTRCCSVSILNFINIFSLFPTKHFPPHRIIIQIKRTQTDISSKEMSPAIVPILVSTRDNDICCPCVQCPASRAGLPGLGINRNCLYNDDCVCESHYINYCYDLKLQGVWCDWSLRSVEPSIPGPLVIVGILGDGVVITPLCRNVIVNHSK